METVASNTSPTGPLATGGAARSAESSGLADSDVTDEINRGGPALGSLMKAIGKVVPASQRGMDEVSVATAQSLSNTSIDVVAIYEQVVNKNGEMEDGRPIIQKLPLINYVMPTFYQWTRVHMQADMQVSEFNSENGFNVKGKRSSVDLNLNGNAGFGLIGGGLGLSNGSIGGGLDFSASEFERGTTATNSVDRAAGQLHLEATLEPRPDITLPRPLIVQKGPRLRVTASGVEQIQGSSPQPPPPGTTPQPTVVGRRVKLSAEFRDLDGQPIADAPLEVRVSQPLLGIVASNDSRTDAEGRLEIQINREGNAFDATRPPESVLVSVSRNLISQQVSISV
ncbi:hypothetical protein [Geodermatophilus telluris]|uniref:hypothetical protein n=1 Tax=Geodermatophilus telluris TaxID=1190417 RepID=UPI001586FA8A|nr:hypothetical protein [Geodermatophilus telluris]